MYPNGDDPTVVPTGYTRISRTVCSTLTLSTYTKTAGVSESLTPTFTLPAIVPESMAFMEISGVNTTTPTNKKSTQCQNAVSIFSTPSLVPNVVGTYPLSFYAVDPGASFISSTPESGWSEVFQASNPSASFEGQADNAVTIDTTTAVTNDVVLTPVSSGAAQLWLLNPTGSSTPSPTPAPYHVPQWASFNIQTSNGANVPANVVNSVFDAATDSTASNSSAVAYTLCTDFRLLGHSAIQTQFPGCRVFHYINAEVKNQTTDALGVTASTTGSLGQLCPTTTTASTTFGTTGSHTVTVASTRDMTNGMSLTVDTGVNQEVVVASSVGSPVNTFTATFTKAHNTAGWLVVTTHFNPSTPADYYMLAMGQDANPENWVFHYIGSINASSRAYMSKNCANPSSFVYVAYYDNPGYAPSIVFWNEYAQGLNTPYTMPWSSGSQPTWNNEFGLWFDHASGSIQDYGHVSNANPLPTPPASFQEAQTDAAYQTLKAAELPQFVHRNGAQFEIMLNALGSLSCNNPCFPAMSPISWFTGIGNVFGAEQEIVFQNTGPTVSTTSTTTIAGPCSSTSPCNVTITVGTTTGISAGRYYTIDSGSSQETIQVISVGTGNFNANFVKAHPVSGYAVTGGLDSPWSTNVAFGLNTTSAMDNSKKYTVNHCGENEEETNVQLRLWCVAITAAGQSNDTTETNGYVFLSEDFSRSQNEVGAYQEGGLFFDPATAYVTMRPYSCTGTSCNVTGSSQTTNGVAAQQPGESGGIFDLIADPTTCGAMAHGKLASGATAKGCVYVREFAQCYWTDQTTLLTTPVQTAIGPCAIIINLRNTAITINSTWFVNTFTHSLDIENGSIYSASGTPIGGLGTFSYNTLPLPSQIPSEHAIVAFP